MPLVRCLHYSVTYPTSTGMQNVGDIFNLTKDLAGYYEKIGWVDILPQELQPVLKRGRKKLESNSPSNLSNSKLNGRLLEHTFK